MTCIVALKDENGHSVILAGDKCGSTAYTQNIYKLPKVFENKPLYIGYTSSFYMGQVLQFDWSVPDKGANESEDHFIFSTVRRSIISLLKEHDYFIKKEDTAYKDGNAYGKFIIVYNNRIFVFQPDASILEVEEYAAVGCGEDFAYGSLYSTSKYYSGHSLDRVSLAIEAASTFSVGVSKEFDYILCKEL